VKRREFITLRSDAADPAWGWMSLSWLAVVIGCLYILSAKPLRSRNVSRRSYRGFDEQIFGPDKQVRGRGQTYLRDIGLTVMWEKQRTSTLLPPPQSEEAEFYPLCQLRP
jgi:hypothetical protein